ncbi:hypothetical protein [Phaeobacter phage MD18]|nr:hypothetical protein [Phaeobacter phage MD18]
MTPETAKSLLERLDQMVTVAADNNAMKKGDLSWALEEHRRLLDVVEGRGSEQGR